MSSILKFISFVILAFFMYIVFKGCSFNIGGSKLAPIISVTNTFLGQLKNKNYKEIYNSLDQEWKSKQDLQGFTSFMQDMENTLGVYEAGTQKNIRTQPTPKGDIAVVQHAANFSKSKNCVITITLRLHNNNWIILGLNFNSPELNKSQVCPKCSLVVDMFAKFCPKCGAAITSQNPKEPLLNQDKQVKEDDGSGTK